MADEKAASLSVSELSSAVDKAVADVLGKHNMEAVPGLAFGPNTVIGRQLRAGVTDVKAVQQAASDLTAQVQESLGTSAKLSPAAIISPGHIIVGFVPETRFEA
ncbi:MAG: hypothetical protein ABR511_02065 [Acidimicrobiales bacterium]